MSSNILIILDTFFGFFLLPIGIAFKFFIRFVRAFFNLNTKKILVIKLLGAGNFLAMQSSIKNYSADIVTVRSNIKSLKHFNIGNHLYVIDDRNLFLLVFSSLKILFLLFFKSYDQVINLEIESRFAKFIALIVPSNRICGLTSHNKSYLDQIIYDQYLVSPLLLSREEIIGQLVKFNPKKNIHIESLLDSNRIEFFKKIKKINFIRFVSIFPSCSSTDEYRRLEFDDWKRVILKLVHNKKIGNISIVFQNNKDLQFNLFHNFLNELGNKKLKIKLTKFYEFASVVKRSDLVVTVDSQALHVAQLYKKRVIAFYGPTSPFGVNLAKNTYPISNSLFCSPCTHKYTRLPCSGKKPCLNFKESDFDIFNF